MTDTTTHRHRHRSRKYHTQRKHLRLVRSLSLAVLPYALFLIGLTLISISFFSYVENESILAMFLTQRDEVQALTDLSPINLNTPAETTAPQTAATNATGRLIVPFFYIGDQFGTIKIPSVEIDVGAYHGDSEKEFRKGVGHYAGSYFPGQGGNILIAGHRTSFFRNFEYLKIGDPVYFETNYGNFTYEVSEFKIIDGKDNSIANDTTSEQLTMYTCYPFTYVGSAPQRYVVICSLVKAEVNP
jgi:LPXTG-site transpeptidase (sortase) family protein